MTVDREDLLEEEIIIVRNSGEIPEIALHTSLYYLLKDEDGPQISLSEEELQSLYDAAIERAKEIVLRDLDPGNRDLGIYRGVARSMVNWQRLQKLCGRINRDCPGFEGTVGSALIGFLETETREVGAGHRSSSVNCSAPEIEAFCAKLCLDPCRLPPGWSSICKC